MINIVTQVCKVIETNIHVCLLAPYHINLQTAGQQVAASAQTKFLLNIMIDDNLRQAKKQ